MATLIARLRWPFQTVGMILIAVGVLAGLWGLGGLVPDDAQSAVSLLAVAGFVIAVPAFVATFLAPVGRAAPLVARSPLRGRVMGVNSPAKGVPSHGSHAYGQSSAIDLLLERRPDPEPRAAFTPATAYASFGAPILAPVDGEVVRVVQHRRDHAARVGPIGLALFVAEGFVREFRGANGILGNHVVVRAADGTHLAVAHLRQRSATVRVGERVTAGRQLAECGNSGNSTEPHVHVQRQDVALAHLALGLPWAIAGAAADGRDGFPAEGTSFDAT